MKFICTQNNLTKGLSQTVPLAGKNVHLPILKYILLQCKNHVLHLTATDLEIGIHAIIGGKMAEEGSCTIPARPFLDYIQQLPTAHAITIEYKNNICFLSTKGFKAQFPTMASDDFPLLPTINQEHSLPLEPAQFSLALTCTVFAASKEELRPEIKSVFIRAEQGKLTVAATDSFRLSEYSIPYTGEQKFQCILPLSSALEVIRLFSDQEALVVLPHDNHITFQSDGVEMTTRLIDGTYPDYEQIIPKSWQTSMVVERDVLLKALKTLTVFLSPDSRRVQFVLSPQKKTLFLHVVGSGAGEGDVDLQISGTGEDLTILLNIQYVIEGLQHMTTREVEFSFGREFEPVIIRPVTKDKPYTYVVMPIQA